MKRHSSQIKQRKSLGQVFLKDEWPCDKIVDVLKSNGVETVLEIGPGGAALTNRLIDAGFKVTSVEKDDRFAERLKNLEDIANVDGQDRFKVVNEDILRFNIEAWVKSSQGKIAICGNIPYNISTPILNSIFPVLDHIQIAVLMVQKEFGERVASDANSKVYGSLSIYAQLRSRVTLEFLVERYCFSPVPAVDSVVISFKAKQNKFEDWLLKKTETLTRNAFSQRRKKLSNSIGKLIEGIEPGELGVDLNRRAETLTPQEFIDLARKIFPKPE